MWRRGETRNLPLSETRRPGAQGAQRRSGYELLGAVALPFLKLSIFSQFVVALDGYGAPKEINMNVKSIYSKCITSYI